ncbi:MAG: dTDP-4-dehydrorhamnose 3,5-epimerase family protein [Candidatus Eisenbacteria bacterium]|nr:dTDP-4-dehydrorhamnose 3,5-epimerase family protein [Candidatus Eisenbacteria bacterium]
MEPVRVEPVRARGHAVIGGSGAEEGRIAGVVVHPIALYPDDRGHFAEVFRDSDPVAEGFAVRQSSITRTRAGVIKAFHYHRFQDDIFCPLTGTARIALVDFRPDSPTYGRANSIFAGELYPKAVRIPAGVAHGYEVLPGADLLMVYYTNQTYNPGDEYRLPYDDPAIGFDGWGVRNR